MSIGHANKRKLSSDCTKCAAVRFTAVSMTVRTQFTVNLFTVAVSFIGTLVNSYSALLENLEGGSFNRDFERWIKEGFGNGESLSVGALWGEIGGEGGAPLLRNPKDIPSKALEMGVCFHRDPS